MSSFWAGGLRQQIFLGDAAFVERLLAARTPAPRDAREVPRAQRSRPVSLAQLLQHGVPRDEALHTVHTQGDATMTKLAEALGLSVSRVSRVIAASEASGAKGKT